jgi:hypothetical protein
MTAASGNMKIFAVIGLEMTVNCLTEPHRLVQHRVEDRGKITGRGIDDLQYLGSGGLLVALPSR